MHVRLLPALGLTLALVAAVAQGQIERLTLDQMVQKTDDAVFGEITAREVIRIDDSIDGPELYFTHLTVEGESLRTGEATTVTVTFPGGFISETDGVWNSEAPSDDDVRLGNRVVVFEKHLANAGGGLECNFLYASHGGLYRTAEGPDGVVVLGRGAGYAIENNTSLVDLEKAVASLVRTVKKKEEL
jgi:hypothetical protein